MEILKALQDLNGLFPIETVLQTLIYYDRFELFRVVLKRFKAQLDQEILSSTFGIALRLG